MKRVFSFFLAALIALPLLAAAQQQVQYGEISPPQAVEAKPGKVEVVEFFWYGCPHCYNLEPYIESWLKKLPPDVEFRRIPAVFNQRWAHDAAIFYTLEAMGLLDKLHRPLFDAIHKDHLRTDSQAAMAEWLQKHGVDDKKFMRRAEQDPARHPADRRLQDRRHSGDGSAGPLYRKRRPRPYATRHAAGGRRAGRDGPQAEVDHELGRFQTMRGCASAPPSARHASMPPRYHRTAL